MLLNVDDRGSGPAVVLLHGYPLNRTMWTELADRLAPRFRVVLPDLPGHGGSDAPSRPYPMGWMADSVLETLDALGVPSPFVLGGLSMGGYVAQALAVEHPGRPRGLVLMNTRAIADTAEQARNREQTAAQVEQTGDVGPVAQAMLPRLLAASSIANQPGLSERVERMMLDTRPAGVAGALRGMAIRPDRLADLPRISVPTLVVASDQDAIVPVAEAQAMAAALPASRLVVIPGVGHLSPMEAPDAVFQAIGSFLTALG